MTAPLISNSTSREPALAVGATTGTVAGLLSLISFVSPDLLTESQTKVILVIAAFVLPVVVAALTRGRVWSPASVKEVLDEAIRGAEDAKNQPDVGTKLRGYNPPSDKPPFKM